MHGSHAEGVEKVAERDAHPLGIGLIESWADREVRLAGDQGDPQVRGRAAELGARRGRT